MSDEEIKIKTAVAFKPKIRKNIRKRAADSSEDETDKPEGDKKSLSKLEEAKELQKLRKRPHGVSVVGLALGKKVTMEEEVTSKDPYNIKTGGMVNMSALKSGKIKTNDDTYDTGIGTQFSAETNKRDEDEEMMKYIDEKISKKQGNDEDKNDEDGPTKYMSPEEAALMALPSHLRHGSTIKSEEMLSNQMLSGIPEIDLGIEAKIKNIEATEEAKQKLLWEQKNKKDGPSIMVPVNMAVNFVQHNRFNVEEEPKRKKFVRHEHPTNKDNKNPKKATDDYHYDKFKKQFRRH